MRSIRRLQRDEGGVVAIIYAMVMLALLGMAALVIDLAQIRTDRRINKSVADMAVRAGLGVLQAGPWSGVCRASEYLLSNSPQFHTYDSTSPKWFQLGSPLTALTTSPCLNTTTIPYKTLCLPGGILGNNTWGKFTATAGGGRYTIEIQSGYSMPDSRFPEDQTAIADTGDPLKGYCDNLVVIITETRASLFGRVLGGSDKTTTVRSVGRISNISNGEYNPAVLLLEPHGCSVLTTSGNNTRVIAQPFLDHPGVIQVDSADDQGGCTSNQAVLNGQSTSGGPSILACSAKTVNPTFGCNVATGDKPSRIGMYALNFTHPSTDYVTSAFPATYGDTQAVRSVQSGRGPVDSIYRSNLAVLDADAKSVVTGNAGKPPGCTTIVNNACTGNGVTWLVLQQTDCNSLATFFSPSNYPLRAASQNVWFNCDLSVSASNAVTLTALDSYVVVTGKLSVTALFAVLDPRKIYVGGTNTGPKVGLDIGNGGNFSIDNPDPTANCVAPVTVTKFSKLVVGQGGFNLGSSGAAHLCQTFVFMANGYGKVPTTNGTPPCTCSGSGYSDYTGNISIGSGSHIDWSAPNLITGRRPTVDEIATTSPFEDLGGWTEAGGANLNQVNGGGNSAMTGVFFLGNSFPFKLAGGSGANVYLSAQFITRTMDVTGGAVVNLVLSPFDTVPFVVYDLTLVR